MKHLNFTTQGLKILTLRQILQKLPIALAQEKAGSTSENLLKEITKIIYSLYRAKYITITKCITKNVYVYNNMMRSIKMQYNVDTIFMNSGNKTHDP